MDSRSQNDSDGGGGRHGGLPSLTGLANMAHDEGRAQSWSLQTLDAPSDPGLNCRLRPHTPPVLSLDQIRISGGSNEYTDGPSAAQRSPATQQRKTEVVTSTGSRTNGQQETEEEVSNNLRNLHSVTHQGNANAPISSREGVSQSSSVEDSQSSIRTSAGSGSSGQRLLGGPVNSNEIIRNQPKRADSEELKPLNAEYRDIEAIPGSRKPLKKDKHSNRCESCGRCKCSECVQPRALPSCWMCGQRCLCSPDKAVEYGTCVCCLKGIFYHCSNDDEDTSADKPFSCSQSRCCVRWTTIAVCSFLCPCLLCYLPGKGCLAMCQCCYDRAARPGCRCKNPTLTRCHDDSTAT
ncbi:protein sprouty homolog 2 [Poecilia reticulata]|uniref:Protein sprouty homolog 2 n=1 Tax=Poecilia reticulata TaxID=8081 RepID=A0A3P9NUC1_POERE|nr:PREDICTED: protein sprouty homolog 2-like [Poecilia reticulata]XP_008426336.1 PREDICTED: protein sprouty homolog 2-like [Poecilia reticulata]